MDWLGFVPEPHSDLIPLPGLLDVLPDFALQFRALVSPDIPPIADTLPGHAHVHITLRDSAKESQLPAPFHGVMPFVRVMR